MAADETPWTFDLCSGRLALDFANTLSNRHTQDPVERLTSFARLVDFAEQENLVTPTQGKRLRAWARSAGAEAEQTRARTVALREAVYALFLAVAEQRQPAEKDLAILTEWTQRLRLDARFEWEWAAGPDAPDAFMAAIVLSALELLKPEARERVHVCGADDCSWLFFDTSKNRTRRWCDMKQCGNRDKVRRFNRRKHAHAAVTRASECTPSE